MFLRKQQIARPQAVFFIFFWWWWGGGGCKASNSVKKSNGEWCETCHYENKPAQYIS